MAGNLGNRPKVLMSINTSAAGSRIAGHILEDADACNVGNLCIWWHHEQGKCRILYWFHSANLEGHEFTPIEKLVTTSKGPKHHMILTIVLNGVISSEHLGIGSFEKIYVKSH